MAQIKDEPTVLNAELDSELTFPSIAPLTDSSAVQIPQTFQQISDQSQLSTSSSESPQMMPLGRSGNIENDETGSKVHKVMSNLERSLSGIDLHPVELAAHALLSTPLDNLHDNFQLLNQLQLILYTRLQLIERRLLALEGVISVDSGANVKTLLERIHGVKKRLQKTLKTMNKVNLRLERVEEKVKKREKEKGI